MNLIEGVVAGIAAGTGNDATTASIASRLELENNQFTLPQGVVKAGAAAASLGEFMSQNGASAEEIQKAQTDLLEWIGTDVPQPATLLLKNWVILMGNAPALAPGAATATGMAVGGAIGGAANLVVQKALNGEQEMSKVDALIAIVDGAITQGRGIVATTLINTSGAAIGAIIKSEEIFGATAGAIVGSTAGSVTGKAITESVKSVAQEGASNIAGAVTGSIASELTSSRTQEILKNKTKNNMKTLVITIYYIISFSITTTLIFIMCTSMVDIYFFITKGISIFDISIIKKSTKAGIIAGITLGIGVRVLEFFKNREIHKTDID